MRKLLCALLGLIFMFSIFSIAEDLPYGEIFVRSSGGSLNLRAGESTNTRSLGYVQQGDIVDIISSAEEWSCVYVRRTGQTGYVKTKYIVNIVYPKIELSGIPSENAFTGYMTTTSLSIPDVFTLDLDGDGALETLRADAEYSQEAGTQLVSLSVWTEGVRRDLYTCELLDSATLWLVRLDDTGRVYIFLCGDEMSDDYVTRCLYWNGTSLQIIPFIAPKPFTSGVAFGGCIESIQNGVITLSSTRDYFGTWFATLPFSLTNGILSFDTNAIWKLQIDLSSAETWEYRSLKTLCELPASLYGVESALPAGTVLLPTAIDDENNRVYFVTASGNQGYFTCTDTKNGWGHSINGIDEDECFETLLYAD